MKLSAKDIRERLKKCYVKDLRNVLGIMVVARKVPGDIKIL